MRIGGEDLLTLAEVYANSFAGEPWYECTTCPVEGLHFGRSMKVGDVCLSPGCSARLVLAYPTDETVSYIEGELSRVKAALFLLRNQAGAIIGFSWGFSYPSVADFVQDKYETSDMRLAISSLLSDLNLGVAGLWYLSESGIRGDSIHRGKGWSRIFHAERLAVAKNYGLDAIQRTSCEGPMYRTSMRLMQQIMGPEAAVNQVTGKLSRTGKIVNGLVDSEKPNRALFVKRATD